jgi:hypothetical protein
MTTEELKYNIIEELIEIKNEEILVAIKSVMDTHKQSSIVISDERKRILDEAKLQINNNDYFTDEDINKEEKNWLKE